MKTINPALFTISEVATISQAYEILESKALTTDAIKSSDYAKQLCITKIGYKEHEVFAIAYLNSQNKLIVFEELSSGTIDAAAVYPREVLKNVLAHNAARVILTHNHPAGSPQPSTADKRITNRLIEALKLIDVQVLDHIIVGVEGTFSFKESGILV